MGLELFFIKSARMNEIYYSDSQKSGLRWHNTHNSYNIMIHTSHTTIIRTRWQDNTVTHTYKVSHNSQ